MTTVTAITKTARQNTSRLTSALKRELGVDADLNISPLGVFKLVVSNTETCDFFLGMNISSHGTGHFDQSQVSNRGKKKVGLERLKGAMKRGTWDPNNGETIKVAMDDSRMMLIDGQHRMQAIREHLEDGGDPIEVTVLCGMSPGSVLTIDTGSSRSVADFLTMCSGGVSAKDMYTQDVSSAGRFAFREAHNTDGHPLKKPDGIEVTEGDIAGWLMETGAADELRDVRHNYTTALGMISSSRYGGNAGAKPWMTYLLSVWKDVDLRLMMDVLNFLASGQLVELPKYKNGRAHQHWEWAREYAQEQWRISQGYRGMNKVTMDKTLVAYAVAWNMSRGSSKHKRICGLPSFTEACDTYWDTGSRDKSGQPIWRKVPEWPGIL